MTSTPVCAIRVLLAAAVIGVAASPGAVAEGTIAHAIAMHGDPKHGPDFQHLDFANPGAPRGGTLTRALVGSYDSLNPFIVLGRSAAGVRDYLFPSLMARSWDEPFTMYGYVAESIETPEDRSWVTFRLNPDARWHDGTPITVDDVIFSMETLRDSGRPSFRRNYERIASVERIGTNGVRFNFSDEADNETALIIALMPVISRAYYGDHTFDETTLDPPLGGGPYRIADLEPGRTIAFERVADWWGADLPVFRGQYNFDTLRFDYFRDATTAMLAFQSGEYNYRFEPSASRWATGYDFPAARDGRVALMDAPHGRPGGMRAFAFNTRRPVFANRRVRQALTYGFDFEWVNANYLHGLYRRTDSFFVNSTLASSGLPEGAELALLEPFRGQIPDSVFTATYAPPSTDGSGNIRQNLRTATRLLDEAGWVVRDRRRVNADTGEPLAFEILLRDSDDEKIALSFVENLKRLGVEASIRQVDSAQYRERTATYDFDMLINRWGVSLSPGAEQHFYWGSESADAEGTKNYPAVRDPVVDALIRAVADATDRDALVAATRALDRVLLSGHYVAPLYYSDTDHIAYWGDLGFVDYQPLYGQIAVVNSWWSNE